MNKTQKKFAWWSALLGLVLATAALPTRSAAQDDQDDPPTRVARLGYMEGSVSFEPAGEDDWVGAVDNRPMTTGDKLWADQDSRAELQLGSAVIRLSQNTGISFLNLDDHTVQVQLSSGAINIRVRRLSANDAFEIDTPNLAFSLDQPGSYRVEASEDGTYSIVTVRDGDGEATGNGQTYTIHAGQQTTFSGTDSLNADVEQIGAPDQFDTWSDGRDHRWENSPSSHYLSADVVGYDDLDENGDWRDEGEYGHVWYPHVEAGWAPYHTGHWDWIDPWGYTWVDDSPWGYAPFHYGRWVSVGGRWGWVAGPVNVQAVYAPALVVFVGGGGGWGGNIGWFPLGPREVYVPSYGVSAGYMNRINVSNTTVSTTVITNVYNTTIINKTTNITNITYANRSVQGAVTAVPQNAFASAQPVAKVSVAVNAEQIRSASVSGRVAVAPTRQAVLGARASAGGRVAAPPAAVASRQVVAKRTPPPAPVSFAQKQQAMAAHPGQPLPKREVAAMRPAASAARPAVKVAPAGKPATATTGHPPANVPRPGVAPGTPGNQTRPNTPAANPVPNNRPEVNQPNNRPEANRPPAAQPTPNRPETNRPPAAEPTPNRPENRPPAPESRPAAPPNTRPETNRPPAAQPAPNRPAPETNRPETNRPEATPRPSTPPPAAERSEQRTPPPAAAKPAPPKKEPAKQTPEEKKKEEKKPQ